MLALNFYKIRTGLDIKPTTQGGTFESNQRYEQIIQLISNQAEIEWMSDRVYELYEDNPTDLGAYIEQENVKLYAFVFGLNKRTSSWTAGALRLALGNMKMPSRLINYNKDAEPWIGGKENNISCEKALFNLRPVKRNN